jgi:hypothetical protein
MKPSPHAIFVALSSTAVVAAIVAGQVMLGSPAQVRAQRLDEQRIRDLQAIANAITQRGVLPDALADIQRSGQWTFLRLTDAASGLPYEYLTKDATAYQLCAQFDTSADRGARTDVGSFWSHGSGRQCFDLGIKKPVQR